MALTQTFPLPTGPVTMDDVRAALGETDPAQTNANKLRAVIGRGSMNTIQRYLDALRAEQAAQHVLPGAVPAAPAETLSALWSSAYSAAELLVRRRLDVLQSERDALTGTVAALRADVEALTVAVDDAEAAVQAQAQAIELERAQRVGDAEVVQAQAGVQTQALADAKARIDALEHAAVLAAAQHATELQRVQHDSATASAALQVALDRASARQAETLALLHAMRPAVPAEAPAARAG